MEKKQPNKSGRLSAAEQQQLAMLQQLDPSLLAYGMPGCFDPTQLLNPLVNPQYAMMNPAALQAFSGLGGRGGAQGTSGGADWWSIMQNQALATGLGAGYLPGMFPGYLPPSDVSKSVPTSSSKGKDETKRNHERMSPRSESKSPSVSRIQHERKSSHESHSSKERPDSHHSVNSPRPSNAKHDSKSALPSWMNSNSNRKMNEQAFQMELLRQFEQQIMLQQLQIQQQQQQHQFNAALESLMTLQNKPNGQSRKNGGETKKAQEQLNVMMAQLMQSGGMQGVSPAMSALLAQPGALETVLAMSQMGGNINALGLSGLSDQAGHGKDPGRDQPSSSSSQTDYPPSSSHASHKHSTSVPSSIMKMYEPSTSPRTSQHGDRNPKVQQPVSIPGLSPTLTAGLSPDHALLAMLYSQQLQYEESVKKHLMPSSKGIDTVKHAMAERDGEIAHSSKKHFSESSLRYHQSAQDSPVATSSARDKCNNSPRHKLSTSPSKKGSEQNDKSQKASTANSSTFKQPTSSKLYDQENMSDTLKLLSTLVSNPNLTQQEVAALLSIPTNVDPSTLLASLGPAAAALIQPSLSRRQMTHADLESLSKNHNDAFDSGKRKFQEHVKAHIEREMGKSANQISVIHQNTFKTPRKSEEPFSSNTREYAYNDKSFSDGNSDIPKHSSQGDATSSDGDVKSEVSAPEKHIGNFHSRNSRPRIPVNDEVLAPLKHGWKREIRFKPFGSQLRGEVVYTTPDKRKLRMYSDVIKYLDDNNIKDLNRSNFSFSTRLRLGRLLERIDGKDGTREWVEISEDDLEQQSHLHERATTSSPFADGSDRMSTYSSSSKGDSKFSSKDKEQDKEKQKEQLRLLKEQEELRRYEQQRIEHEIRERLALEEIERQRIEDQRRQHMILMRALESRKRAEERERRREEMRIEKMLQREKKMEQRRIAMQIARELKMPVEDMAAIGAPELPNLTRLQGTYDNTCPHQLSGNASADLLMVLEFVKTFKDCLRISDGVALTFEQFQLGLLNDPKHTSTLVRLTIALLHQCLCDPGVPAPGPWLHCLTGVKVTDIDVSEDNYSEILRLFIWARSGFKTEIAVKLESLSFLSLSADEKATSLAFLVNELVCSRPICMEIEKNLDTIASLKRDKWVVEGQMRQLRIAYEKNPGADVMAVDDDSSSALSTKSGTIGDEMGDGAEENAEAVFQKKMEELTQQHNSCNTQLASNVKPLRALDLGQDRFKRRYWVLPNLGGVYVEGLESGISYEDDDESPDEEEGDEDVEEDNIEAEKNSDSAVALVNQKTDHNIPDDEVSMKLSNSVDAENDPVSSVSQSGNDLVHETKSLDDPTASSKDIAKVLMMLSQEPVNHDINKPKNITVEKTNKPQSENDNSGTTDNSQMSAESQEIIDSNASQDALDAVSALNTMKANCETKADTTGLSSSDHSVDRDAPKAPSPIKILPDFHGKLNTPCDQQNPDKNSEDSVIAAAKAIAAKAVASTSHLLFPKNESPTKLKSKNDVTTTKCKDLNSHMLHTADNSTMPIGEHTINALVQMGLNPASLSPQQLEALSHLDIPMALPTGESTKNIGSVEPNSIKPDMEFPRKLEADIDIQNSVPEAETNLDDQDSPMDLSRTDDNEISKSDNVAASIKTEATLNRGSPFPLQESPDPKSSDSKFFIPIPFANGSKNNIKSEQQQYNEMVYSCPSPSILANYIISSANYGQLPPLDDIKFPIRPPDVKEEPDVIPREQKRGWWRIESESDLRNLSEKLHLRGIREKQLHRNITKNFEFCTSSMVDSLKPEHVFTVLSKNGIPDAEDSVKNKPEKVKKSGLISSKQDKNSEDIPSRFLTSNSLAFQAELAVLKQVEDLASRCLSMGIVSPQWQTDHVKPSISRKDLTHVPIGPLRDHLGIEIKFDITNPIQHDPTSALGAAVEFLATLEHAVCRRYLKPPLVRKGGASEFSSLPSLSESGALDVAAGLRTWRNAVVSSASAAQLALCVRMLDSCIAWDRSAHQSSSNDEPITTGLKNKKRKSDKRTLPKNSPASESSHPPKKKRKKKTVPIKITVSPSKVKKAKRMPIDTADVISKAHVLDGSYTNGQVELDNHDGDVSTSDNFEASFNSATEESSALLGNHVHSEVRNGPDLNVTGSPGFIHPNSDNMSDEYKPNAEPKKKKKKKKIKCDTQNEAPTKKVNKPRKRADKDVVICRGILQELQSHEDATWFLFPVDCKLVPGYRKIIKKPIDFHTIESRLKRGRYKSKEDFVSEVRLVFDNCQKFNEDNSNIGRAGYNIRSFFEKRWAEVLKDKFGITVPAEETVRDEVTRAIYPQTNVSPSDDQFLHDQDSSNQSTPDQNSMTMDIDET